MACTRVRAGCRFGQGTVAEGVDVQEVQDWRGNSGRVAKKLRPPKKVQRAIPHIWRL
jgi:hypothetical protein